MKANELTIAPQVKTMNLSAKIYRKSSESNNNSVESQIEVIPTETSRTQVDTLADRLGIILIVYLILMMGAIAFAKIWIHRKNAQKDTIQFWRYLNRVPCKKCRFFAENNPYLKCAVNPSTVLTKDAIDCSDYCPKGKK